MTNMMPPFMIAQAQQESTQAGNQYETLIAAGISLAILLTILFIWRDK